SPKERRRSITPRTRGRGRDGWMHARGMCACKETTMPHKPALHGLMAEFDNPSALVRAARATYDAGYRRMDAYSPFPIEELADALGFHHTRLPFIVLLGGLIGGLGGFWMQYWCMAIDYPVNVGGRPLNSWPAFIPVTFELTILGAALAAVFGLLG